MPPLSSGKDQDSRRRLIITHKPGQSWEPPSMGSDTEGWRCQRRSSAVDQTAHRSALPPNPKWEPETLGCVRPALPPCFWAAHKNAYWKWRHICYNLILPVAVDNPVFQFQKRKEHWESQDYLFNKGHAERSLLPIYWLKYPWGGKKTVFYIANM